MDAGTGFLNELLNIIEWCFVLNEDTGRLVYANRRIMREYGEEVLYRPWNQVFADTFFARIFSEERPENDESFWELADSRTNKYLLVRSRWIDIDGVTYRLGTVSSTCEISGVSRDMALLTIEYREMMEEKQRLLEEVEWFAYHDQLTRLGNRNKFMRDSGSIFLNCEGLGIINLDINNLKKINDHYGHLAGDRAIKSVGEILLCLSDEADTYCYRMGGDEFLLVETECDEVNQRAVCERIRSYLRKKKENGETCGCEVAIGNVIGEAGMCLEELQKLSDSRMYADKRKAYVNA